MPVQTRSFLISIAGHSRKVLNPRFAAEEASDAPHGQDGGALSAPGRVWVAVALRDEAQPGSALQPQSRGDEGNAVSASSVTAVQSAPACPAAARCR